MSAYFSFGMALSQRGSHAMLKHGGQSAIRVLAMSLRVGIADLSGVAISLFLLFSS